MMIDDESEMMSSDNFHGPKYYLLVIISASKTYITCKFQLPLS